MDEGRIGLRRKVNRMTAFNFETDCFLPSPPTETPSVGTGPHIPVLDIDRHRIPREHVVPAVGRRLIVRCDQPHCDHAAVIDPRKAFGSLRDWPGRGRSERFRCVCGSRRSLVDYTSNAEVRDGPIDAASLALWF